MAEQLTEETTRPEATEVPKGTWITSGEVFDIETYLANQRAGKFDSYPTAKAAESTTPEVQPSVPEVEPFHLSERAKKGLIRAAVVLVGGIVVTGSVIGISNLVSHQTTPQNIDHGTKKVAGPLTVKPIALPANGITMEKSLAYGQDSLKPQYCQVPGAIYGVWTVSGAMNMEPEFNDAAHPDTLIPLNPYMLPELESKANQTALKNYNTTTGYNQVTLNNLPLGLTICDLHNAVKVNSTTGKYFVDRSKLTLKFEDPSTTSMTDTTIKYLPQTGSATGIKLDATKGQYATLPDPKNNMFVPTIPTDSVFNASRAKFLADVQSPNEVKAIIALAEQKAVADINVDINATDMVMTKGQNISYIDGTKESDVVDMRAAIDLLLTQRLGLSAKNITFTNSYDATSDTPIVPNTTKLITDPTARWIKGLNTNVDFNLTETTVQFGSVKVPASTTKKTTP